MVSAIDNRCWWKRNHCRRRALSTNRRRIRLALLSGKKEEATSIKHAKVLVRPSVSLPKLSLANFTLA